MNTYRRFLLAIPLALVAFLISACIGPVPPVGVKVTPDGPIELAPAGQQIFSAVVTGSDTTTVTWSTELGTIDASGNNATYTAPSALGTDTVTATSDADPSRRGSVAINVVAAAVTQLSVVPDQDPLIGKFDTPVDGTFTIFNEGAEVSYLATSPDVSFPSEMGTVPAASAAVRGQVTVEFTGMCSPEGTSTLPLFLEFRTPGGALIPDAPSQVEFEMRCDTTSVSYPASYQTMVFDSTPGRTAVLATVIIPEVAGAVRYRIVGTGGHDPDFFLDGPIVYGSPFDHDFMDQAPSGVSWQLLSGSYGPADSTAERVPYYDSRFEDFEWEVTAYFE